MINIKQFDGFHVKKSVLSVLIDGGQKFVGFPLSVSDSLTERGFSTDMHASCGN